MLFRLSLNAMIDVSTRCASHHEHRFEFLKLSQVFEVLSVERYFSAEKSPQVFSFLELVGIGVNDENEFIRGYVLAQAWCCGKLQIDPF